MSLINLLFKSLSNKPKGGDEINPETMLGINGSLEADKEFVGKASKLKFPSFKQLLLGYMDQYETKDDIVNMNYFMTNAISSPIKYLTMSGGNHGNLSRFKTGISRIPKMVTREVYLIAFEIDEPSLKSIIEASAEVPRLVMCNCKVSLTNNFSLEKNLEYNITELDLYETYRKTDDAYLTLKKAGYLVSAMARTPLKHTLKIVHVAEKECVGKSPGVYGKPFINQFCSC